MNTSTRPIHLLLLATAILGAAPLSGCLFDGPITCTDIPADQKASLMPPMDNSGPVIVQIDARFTPTQVTSIQEAIAIWNAFGQTSLHRSFFEARIGSVGSGQAPTSVSDCDFGGSSDADFHLIREDSETQWKSLGLSDRNPGVTIRCRRGNSLAKQAVLINTRYSAPTQLTSIVLHELGHAVGLDHSCVMDNGKPDYASCFGLSEDHPYHAAVMYPSLRTGLSAESMEIKDTLQSNDRERAQCLYQD